MSDSRLFPERIAALIPSEAIGPGRQLTSLARALREAGIDCMVVVLHRRGRPPSVLPRFLQDAGVPHCVVEDRGPFDWRLALTVRAVLRRWRPSIVQTHCYKATAIAFLLRRLRPAWPWIGFFHGSTTTNLKSRLYQWVDHWLLGAADRIVVMSQAQAQAFHGRRRRVRTIYNAALDLPHPANPSDDDTIAVLARGLRRPIVGVVGRLSEEKGVDLFLDACAMLVQKGLALSGVVVGDGPQRARLEARCVALGLASDVRFLGQVSNVDAVYRTLDLLVLPSRSEGLPNTMLEGMRADVPVLATAVGAVPDIVGASSAARLVTPGSAASLADAMEHALTQGDPPSAPAARRDVVNRLSLERRVEAHIRLYRGVLEECGHPARHPEDISTACVGSPAP